MAASPYVAHHVPGRLRLKVPDAGHGELQALARVFDGIDGVERVSVRPHARSVVIEYRPREFARFANELHHALSGVSDRFWTAVGHPGTPAAGVCDRRPSNLADTLTGAFDVVNRIVKHGTGNLVDLKVLIPALLATAAAVAPREKGTPLWFSLLQFAANLHLGMNKPKAMVVERRDGACLPAPPGALH